MLKHCNPSNFVRLKFRQSGNKYFGVSASETKIKMSQIIDTRLNIKHIFETAVNAVIPNLLIRNTLKMKSDSDLEVDGRRYKLNKNCFIVGFGKAVVGMAAEVERIVGDHLCGGLLSVPIGIIDTIKNIPEILPIENTKLKIMEGAKNNLPDKMAENAAKEIEKVVKNLPNGALLTVLISGGGSALLPAPTLGITLEEKYFIIQLLNSVGANIMELNCVRKKLSNLKGGGLAELAYPHKVLCLILSDVVGDDLNYIASGPTVINSDAPDAALKIIQGYNLFDKVPSSVKICLAGSSKPQEKGHFTNVHNLIIGSNSIALKFAKSEAFQQKYHPVIISSKILNSVEEISEIYCSLAINICKVLSGTISMKKFTNFLTKIHSDIKCEHCFEEEIVAGILGFSQSKGLCLLAGGETTVLVKGKGLGGRNQELALTFSIKMSEAMENNPDLKKFNVMLLSAGTDGIDGPTTAAGALGYSQQIEAANQQNLDAKNYLCNNDSFNFYTILSGGNDLIVTGHTGTNVMDIHVITIEKN